MWICTNIPWLYERNKMKLPISSQLAENVNLHIIQCDNFKTTSINIFIPCELASDVYTLRAAVPYVLARGTQNHPDRKCINKYMKDLYGATYSCGVRKYGFDQILNFGISTVDDRYVNSSDNLFEHAVGFLHELIFEPLRDNGVFRQDYVVQERDNLKQQILSIINDKEEYAKFRLNELMNPGEPYTRCVFGDINEINSVNADLLWNVYKETVFEMPMDIFVVGNVELQQVEDAFVKKFNFTARKPHTHHDIKNIYPQEVKQFKETANVKQGKLNIGYRTNIQPLSDDHFKLCMFNEIFGGGANSKLFVNVREKSSLCYSVYSSVNKFTRQMSVATGIEPANKQKAYDLINLQLDAMRKGDISDFEMDCAKKEYRTSLRAVSDSATAAVNFYYGNIIAAGKFVSPEEYNQNTEKVTKDDIVNIANQIKEDSVFFLTNE